jgi:WD40 repeat protein
MVLLCATTAARQNVDTLPPLEPLTRNNIAQVKPLARLGSGVLTSVLAWSPDGKTLAVGGSSGVWLYQSADWTAAPQTIPTEGEVTQIDYNPDGKTLGYVANGTLYLWDVATQKIVEQIEAVQAFAFHPSDNLLAFGREQWTPGDDSTPGFWSAAVELWNTQTHSSVKWMSLDAVYGGGSFTRLTFNTDGSALAASWTGNELSTCGDRRILSYWWPMKDILRQPQAEFDAVEADIGASWEDEYGLVLNPADGHFATISWDEMSYVPTSLVNNHDPASQTSKTFRLGTRVLFPTDSGGTFEMDEQLTALTISPDGKTLAAALSSDPQNVVRFVDMETGTVDQEWRLKSAVDALKYSPNGQKLAIAGDGQIWVGSRYGDREALLGITRAQTGGQRNDTGTAFLSRDIHNQLNLWVVEPGRVLSRALPETDASAAARFVPGDQLLMFDDPPRLTLWNYHTGHEVVLDLSERRRTAPLVNFSPDGKLAALQKLSGEIQLFDTASGGLLATLADRFPNPVVLAFSPDGAQLVTAHFQKLEDKTAAFAEVRQWDTSTGKLTHDYGSFRGSYQTGQFFEGEVRLQFSPDGAQLAVQNSFVQRVGDTAQESRDGVSIFDVKTGSLTFHHEQTGDRGNLSPDFHIYAADPSDWSNVEIHLFDTTTGQELTKDSPVYSSYEGGVSAFSSDDASLLLYVGSYTNCGGDYRAYLLYSIKDGKEVASIGLPSVIGGWGTESAIFSPAGDMLLVSTHYGGQIVDTQSGKDIANIGGLRDSELTFSPDGTMLIAMKPDGTVALWGVPKQQ